MRRPKGVGLLLACLWAPLAPAAAHGVDHRVVDDVSAVVVGFAWSGGGPVGPATARLFGPGDAEPWSVLRSDAHGRLAFVPDRPGLWRVELQADPEHRVVREILVDPGLVAAPSPDWRRLLLPVSLTLNLVLLAGLWGTHRLAAMLRANLHGGSARP